MATVGKQEISTFSAHIYQTEDNSLLTIPNQEADCNNKTKYQRHTLS